MLTNQPKTRALWQVASLSPVYWQWRLPLHSLSWPTVTHSNTKTASNRVMSLATNATSFTPHSDKCLMGYACQQGFQSLLASLHIGSLVAAKQSTTQPHCRCWVGFRGGLNDNSRWVSDWYRSPSTLGGIRIERSDDRPCRVADWRVVLEEPADMKIGPEVSEGELWKMVPTDPR